MTIGVIVGTLVLAIFLYTLIGGVCNRVFNDSTLPDGIMVIWPFVLLVGALWITFHLPSRLPRAKCTRTPEPDRVSERILCDHCRTEISRGPYR